MIKDRFADLKKKNWADEKPKDMNVVGWGQGASTSVDSKDRELAAFKYDCPSFLKVPKGSSPFVVMYCDYDLVESSVSSIHCEFYGDKENEDSKIPGGFTGIISATRDNDLDTMMIRLEGTMYLEIRSEETAILAPFSAITPQGLLPDIRLGHSYLFGLNDKEKCIAKYTRFVIDCDLFGDCGYGPDGLELYGHLE
jgi:hypothetical protein